MELGFVDCSRVTPFRLKRESLVVASALEIFFETCRHHLAISGNVPLESIPFMHQGIAFDAQVDDVTRAECTACIRTVPCPVHYMYYCSLQITIKVAYIDSTRDKYYSIRKLECCRISLSEWHCRQEAHTRQQVVVEE